MKCQCRIIQTYPPREIIRHVCPDCGTCWACCECRWVTTRKTLDEDDKATLDRIVGAFRATYHLPGLAYGGGA